MDCAGITMTGSLKSTRHFLPEPVGILTHEATAALRNLRIQIAVQRRACLIGWLHCLVKPCKFTARYVAALGRARVSL